MEVINNFFSRSQHKPHNDSLSSSSGGAKYKWHRKRSKPSKKTDPEVLNTGVELSSDSSSDPYPGMVRAPATDPCVVCANDVECVYVLIKCGHQACIDCWRSFASSQVSAFAMAHITCIACDRRLSRALTIQLLKPRLPNIDSNLEAYRSFEQHRANAENIYQRYEDFLLRQCLARDKRTRWCPRGCGYAVLAGNGFRACPRIECQHKECTGGAFCYKCHGIWSSDQGEHVCKRPVNSNIATAANDGSSEFPPENHRSLLSHLQQLFRLPTANTANPRQSPDDLESGSDGGTAVSRKFSTTAIPVQVTLPESNTDDEIEENVITEKRLNADISKVKLDLPDNLNGEVKACPRCNTLLLKLDDGSCNHMTCFICGCEFCWLCLREVRDTHFLSPTGCTFWGRTRWPFRRRICAMLIAAFGTPFILTIVTALAIPGISIGFPAYAVHEVGQRVAGNKWKRIFVKTLSFFGGLVVSPIITALVALFGIPLVLIYVYIFMPLTLFSELKVGLSSTHPSSTAKSVDPEVGFKINWARVGEAAASNTDSVELLTASESASSSRHSSPRCSSSSVSSTNTNAKRH